MTTPLSKIPDFRPEAMPVVGIDSHLPPIAPQQLSAAALRRRFEETGRAWEPEIMREHRFVDRQPASAAVLIPIVMHESATVLLTERTAHLSSHSGQIAFPGGKTDATDPDAAFTAMREAEEEVGLRAEFIDVIGTLPTYVTGTAFVITPVVALVRPGFVLVPNAHEVADAFEVPLAFLMNPANHQRHTLEYDNVRRDWFSMPYRDGDRERFIWGATAGMLRNLYRFLAA